ncbi:PMD domain-containing protein [Sesbania bispinosa]|nr:PMD domain-containing protein [Sesbania bispinosa]
MEDSSLELIPKSISFTTWACLPPARANPVNALGRKWMTKFIPTYLVAPSLLRSRLISEEFPWSTIHFMTRATSTGCWSEWFDYVFSNDAPFVEILTKVGVADAIRMSSKLGTIQRVEDLDALNATIESAKYSQEFLARRRNDPIPSDPASKTPPRKVRGTGNVLPPEKRKRVFHPGPPISQPLKRATFLAFWLSKYVFPGPPWESVSPGVFLLACLLAEGTGLPLVPLFLGGFYGLCRNLLLKEKGVPLSPEHGAGLWVAHDIHFLTLLMKRISSSIVPTCLIFFLEWIPYIVCIMHEGTFSTRNNRSLRSEGVFDMWRLILHPRFLPGFLVTDTVFVVEVPSGLTLIAWIVAVLFKANEALPAFGPSKLVPSTQMGRVLDVWVAYYAKMRTSVNRCVRETSQRAFLGVPIMCKDPYFVTTFTREKQKSACTVTEGASSKKRKSSSVQEPKTKSSDQDALASKKKKNAPTSKVFSLDNVPDTPVRKQGATRSPKSKKKPARPTRASTRLRAKPSPKDLPLTSLSNPLTDVSKDANMHVASPQGKDASFSPGGSSKAMVLAFSFPTASLAPDLSVEVVPILGSLLSDEDAKFLHFIRSHHTIALLRTHKEKVMSDLKALSLFGFKGAWFDELSRSLDRHIPSAALEDLDKIREATMNQEKQNTDLKAQIERLKLELNQGELELERLSAKRREIEDAHAGLDVLLNV